MDKFALLLLCFQLVFCLKFTNRFTLKDGVQYPWISDIHLDIHGRYGYATDGNFLWKFDAVNQGNTSVGNPVQLFGGKNGNYVRGIFATDDYVYVPQGLCVGCDIGVSIAIVNIKSWKLEKVLTIQSKGFSDAVMSSDQRYALLVDDTQLWRLDLNTHKTINLTVVNEDENILQQIEVNNGKAFLISNGATSTLYEVHIEKWQVLSAVRPFPNEFGPDVLLVDDTYIYMAGTNITEILNYNMLVRVRRSDLGLDATLELKGDIYAMFGGWKVDQMGYFYTDTFLYVVDLRAWKVVSITRSSSSGDSILTLSCSALGATKKYALFGSGQQMPPLAAVFTLQL